VSTIAEWLTSLGMSEYAERFVENGIDISVLPELTEQDFEKLGVLLGHRRKMLRAIRGGGGDSAAIAPVNPEQSATTIATPRNAAERRQLTVMFCDLVGSTALSAAMDPEDLRDLIGAYHRCAAATMSRFDGFVAKYMGDGVLIYFGYPQAHEDDPERAVRAGLALIDAVGQLRNIEPLQVRIGVGTGLVVVGDLVGSGESQERGVVGETPNLAARLQAVAPPDTIVIDPMTRRLLVELFEYRDLGPIEVKGFKAAVHAHQVVRPSLVESRFEAMRTTATPLVGRDEEIEIFMRRWQRAKDGDGQVVLISGEPGIGKSRITQAFQDRLGTEPATRLRYFCSPHHQDSALYPVISGLERAAGFRRDDTKEQRLAKLETMLAEGTNDLSQPVSLLAELLSIPTGDRYAPLNLTPQKRKEKTLKALSAQVEGLAAKQPVLMIFEDAHWIDPTSYEALDLIIDQAPRFRVLLLITYRPEFAPPWVGRSQVTLLTLNRLPPRQRAQMISGVIGGKALPREIVDQIVERTDGIPLFIEELTKAVVESGVVAEAGGQYQIANRPAPLAVPTSLHASLLARLDRLAPVREVAQIASALGRQFSHELISAVSMIPKLRLDDALDQLVSAELIFRRGTAPDAEYTFKHALVQDAAYSTLLRARRQQIHTRIVTVLEEKFADIVATQPALLAQHCAEAGLTEKAVGYWLNAGQQSVARAAMTEAVALLRKGLDIITGVSDGVARQELELSLQITLGHALMAAKGIGAPEPGEAFARARQLCKELNQSMQLGSVLIGQFLFRIVRGELEQAENHAREIRELGDSRNDAMWKCFGSVFSGNSCWWLGKFVEARAYLENALYLWDQKYGAIVPTPQDPYLRSLIFLFRTLLCLGHIDQARLRRDEALAEARRLSPYNLVFALCHVWYGNWAIERGEAMLRTAEEVLVISSEQGFPLWLAVGNVMRGWSLGAVGRPAEGLAVLMEGIGSYYATDAKLVVPFYLMTLAELYGMVGQAEEGLKRLDEAANVADMTHERWAEAEMYRLRGTLYASINEQTAAENAYGCAITVARTQSAKFWELRAALDLARLWREQGKSVQARELLLPICNWFTEGFDVPVLNEAQVLLRSLQ
jgi:class 3 adenylate cyclase/tetratricopeptide (TPR) repeat protein